MLTYDVYFSKLDDDLYQALQRCYNLRVVKAAPNCIRCTVECPFSIAEEINQFTCVLLIEPREEQPIRSRKQR